MKYLFLFLFIPISCFCATEDTTSNTKDLEQQLDDYQKRLTLMEQHQQRQSGLYDQSQTSISNQLSASSYSLAVFGIFFGVLGIGIGIYITYIERKVVRIKEDNTKLLAQTMLAKEQVEALNHLIQKDISGLYLKIKKEETDHIIKRIIAVPEDLGNLLDSLLSRELEGENFSSLKQAYDKLNPSIPHEYGPLQKKYMLLFFQHFFGEVAKDDKLFTDAMPYIYGSIQCAFGNDILKSTSDLTRSVMEMGYDKHRSKLSVFVSHLEKSKYQDNTAVYNIIFDGIKDRDRKFDFVSKLYPELTKAKLKFGELLIDAYSNTTLSAEEATLINDLRRYNPL